MIVPDPSLAEDPGDGLAAVVALRRLADRLEARDVELPYAMKP